MPPRLLAPLLVSGVPALPLPPTAFLASRARLATLIIFYLLLLQEPNKRKYPESQTILPISARLCEVLIWTSKKLEGEKKRDPRWAYHETQRGLGESPIKNYELIVRTKVIINAIARRFITRLKKCSDQYLVL